MTPPHPPTTPNDFHGKLVRRFPHHPSTTGPTWSPRLTFPPTYHTCPTYLECTRHALMPLTTTRSYSGPTLLGANLVTTIILRYGPHPLRRSTHGHRRTQTSFIPQRFTHHPPRSSLLQFTSSPLHLARRLLHAQCNKTPPWRIPVLMFASRTITPSSTTSRTYHRSLLAWWSQHLCLLKPYAPNKASFQSNSLMVPAICSPSYTTHMLRTPSSPRLTSCGPVTRSPRGFKQVVTRPRRVIPSLSMMPLAAIYLSSHWLCTTVYNTAQLYPHRHR